jgi:AcrR family transcriptional regulator
LPSFDADEMVRGASKPIRRLGASEGEKKASVHEAAVNEEASSRRRMGGPAPATPFPPSLVHAPEQRLMQAMLLAAGELGYERTTVQDVVERARAGRATFYKHFADKEDCFRRAHEQVSAWAYERLVARARGAEDGRGALRIAIAEAVEVCAASPQIATAVLVCPHVVGGAALEAHDRLLNRLAGALDRLREDPSVAPKPPAKAAPFTVGAIETLLRNALMAGEAARLRELLPRLVFVAMTQYFGIETAWEEMGSEAAGGT